MKEIPGDNNRIIPGSLKGSLVADTFSSEISYGPWQLGMMFPDSGSPYRTLLAGGASGIWVLSATGLDIGAGSGWTADVQSWPITGAVDGAAYQLTFTITGGTDAHADYFMLAASDAGGTATHGTMSGKYSTPATTHTFEFIAPPSTTKIVATRQPTFTGTISLTSCKRITLNPAVTMPTPKATYCYSHTTSSLAITWLTEPVASREPGSPDLSLTGDIRKSALWQPVGGTPTFSAGVADISMTAHLFTVGNGVQFTSSATLPPEIAGGVTYYVVAIATNTFQVSATPGGSAIVPTTAGSGTLQCYRSDQSYKMDKPYVTDATELATVRGAGFWSRGLRHEAIKGHFTFANATYNSLQFGLHNGDNLDVARFYNYGPVTILDTYNDVGMTTHHGRFADTARAATVTISIATPGVVTYTAHGLHEGQPFTLTTTGALPTGLTVGTTYYVRRVINANTFAVSATLNGAEIATSGTQSGVHTLNAEGTGNIGGLSFENTPRDRSTPAVVVNYYARNHCDAIADTKHPNLWMDGITYDVSNGGDVCYRGIAAHDDYQIAGYTTGLSAAFVGLSNAVLPDFYSIDGFGRLFRFSTARAVIDCFNVFVDGEKVVSYAHAVARGWCSGVPDDNTLGGLSSTNLPVRTLPSASTPDAAKWAVLAVKVQVRKNGTSTWYDAPLPYSGPFPAGARQYQFDPTAIAGAGIAAGDTVDVRLGHFDGTNWAYAAPDGVAAYLTMTLGAGMSAERTAILAAGSTLVGLTGTNWTVGTGGYKTTGSGSYLRESSPYVPVAGRRYRLIMTVGAATANYLQPRIAGSPNQSGDTVGNGPTAAGTYTQQITTAAGATSIGVFPVNAATTADGVTLSAKEISFMGDIA